MSQIVFDPDKVRAMYDAVRSTGFPVLAGVMPLRSLRNAEFVANEVPGVTVPPLVLDRMRDKGPEEARQEGIRIAKEIVDVALECGAPGVYVVPPFNDADAALEVVRHARARWAAARLFGLSMPPKRAFKVILEKSPMALFLTVWPVFLGAVFLGIGEAGAGLFPSAPPPASRQSPP